MTLDDALTTVDAQYAVDSSMISSLPSALGSKLGHALDTVIDDYLVVPLSARSRAQSCARHDAVVDVGFDFARHVDRLDHVVLVLDLTRRSIIRDALLVRHVGLGSHYMNT